MTPDPGMTRCHGIGCRVRERCVRHRAIGADEMAPHGTRPDAHYADNLGGGPACRFRIVPAEPAKEGSMA